MAPETLRIESRELKFRLLQPDSPHSSRVDGWTVREEYEPDKFASYEPSLGSYRLILEADVETSEEVEDRFAKGVELAEYLEDVWLYVAGLPLHRDGFFLSLEALRPPPNWSSNVKSVRRSIDAREGGLIADIGFETVHRRYGPAFPLRRALDARERFVAADSLTRALIELHLGGHRAGGFHEAAFLFAKGLEIVRKLLPGRTDAHRAQSLPQVVREGMSISLARLYEESNTRFDTRHAVTRDKEPVLNPPMDTKDLLKFLNTSDVVIRAVVCQRLGLDQITVGHEGPPREY